MLGIAPCGLDATVLAKPMPPAAAAAAARCAAPASWIAAEAMIGGAGGGGGGGGGDVLEPAGVEKLMCAFRSLNLVAENGFEPVVMSHAS